MSGHKNTLYVTTQGAYVAKDHENVQVRAESEVRLSVPFHHLSGILCFGRVTVSPDLLGECGDRGILVSLLSLNGHFLGRFEGPLNGSSVLRQAQYRASDDPTKRLAIARCVVLAKIANARTTLQRGAREADDAAIREALSNGARRLVLAGRAAERVDDIDALRGHEGEAAAEYFSVFDGLIRHQRYDFRFEKRSRRPPLDPMNALLSFLYALLLHDSSSALNAVGLDPAIGYLHSERPGRPSLSLDLMEEFRSFLADRTALALVNLGQVKGEGFRKLETGAVEMDDVTRKAVIGAYQKRKQEAIRHPFTEEETTIGLLLHVQTRLLARAIRGDLELYPPFIAR